MKEREVVFHESGAIPQPIFQADGRAPAAKVSGQSIVTDERLDLALFGAKAPGIDNQWYFGPGDRHAFLGNLPNRQGRTSPQIYGQSNCLVTGAKS